MGTAATRKLNEWLDEIKEREKNIISIYVCFDLIHMVENHFELNHASKWTNDTRLLFTKNTKLTVDELEDIVIEYAEKLNCGLIKSYLYYDENYVTEYFETTIINHGGEKVTLSFSIGRVPLAGLNLLITENVYSPPIMTNYKTVSCRV